MPSTVALSELDESMEVACYWQDISDIFVPMKSRGQQLREARQSAGMTQAELERRSGVPQSNLSSYERGTRPISEAMLDRLTTAINKQTPSHRVQVHRAEVLRALVESGASDPAVFGSVARGQDHPGSDLDLLITAGPDTSLIDLALLSERLEDILGCKVDIVTRGALRSEDDRLVADQVPL